MGDILSSGTAIIDEVIATLKSWHMRAEAIGLTDHFPDHAEEVGSAIATKVQGLK